MNRTAEIISIGDEMTSGARLDTNTQWLSRRLGELGIEVRFHTTVGDDLAANAEVFRSACQRVDYVVSTGGLGPTRDDLTRETLAVVSGTELVLHEDSLRHIHSLFASRGREMPRRNEVQAMFPKTAEPVFNPDGTAPGIDLLVENESDGHCRVFALPGVPAEMKTMFDDTVVSRILSGDSGPRVIRHCVLKLFGVGESRMEELLGDMIHRERQPRVGITVSAATISLRITATAENEDRCEQLIADTKAEVLRRAGEYYFGEGETLEQHHVVRRMLTERGRSLLVIELGYAAPLGDWFATLGGTPAYVGGISLVGRRDLSAITAEYDFEKAIYRLLERFGGTDALIVDGYPNLADRNPSEGQDDVRLIALSPNSVRTESTITPAGHPSIIQPRIAKSALAMLRKVLQNQ